VNLSNSFTLEALVFSETATRRGIPNVPNDEQVFNLTELAQSLERVQSLLGFPLHISSGFRSPKLNSIIGGSVNSAHLEGYACDFTCESFGTPLEVCKAIAGSDIAFDQCIYEGGKINGGGWAHFSIAPSMRGQTLTATFTNGIPHYTNGLA